MATYDENYYHRKCYLEREPQVPTQSVMKQKMGEPLAKVYFKYMTPKLKVLAGLEPPMKGGGNDWYMPPYDILKSTAVLKPVKKEHLAKLSYDGIYGYSVKFGEDHLKNLEEEKVAALKANDKYWKKHIEITCNAQWDDKSKEAARINTEKIRQALREFTSVYKTSLTNVEGLLFEAGMKEIKRVSDEAFIIMQSKYETLLKQQATALYDKYEEKLKKKKAAMKAAFIRKVEEKRSYLNEKVRDIKLEKHVAVEKLRHLLQCQNTACQVYVALKEREECEKELALSTYEHRKKIKSLLEDIQLKDFEIKLAAEKENKRREFKRIWQRKVLEVVKKFQIFVSYSLNVLPEYAEFFLNMEKLMMLQLEEAVDNPSAENVFEAEPPDEYKTPIPDVHPFYVVCEEGYRPQAIDRKLCPIHYTASAEQFPVLIVNKRHIYSACDNFELFPDKIKSFLEGQRGDDADVADDHKYEYAYPVKYTDSARLREIQLESSLMQIIQKERPNTRDVPVECLICKLPYCFCSPLRASDMSFHELPPRKAQSLGSLPSGTKINTRGQELEHEREPKWKSYLEFVKPKCVCAKSAKKHLLEHLPAYMRNMSGFDAPDLPNYECCDVATIKNLVFKAQRKHLPAPPLEKAPSKTRDFSTQTVDEMFEALCTCFSDDEIEKLLHDIMSQSKLNKYRAQDQFKVVDGSLSLIDMTMASTSFATDRAKSLKNLLDNSSNLEDIFMKDNLSFQSQTSPSPLPPSPT